MSYLKENNWTGQRVITALDKIENELVSKDAVIANINQGTLTTTSQTIKGAINEINAKPGGNGGTVTSVISANSDIAVSNTSTTPQLTLNTGTGANQIVKRDSMGRLTGDGSQLTGITGGSGTVTILSPYMDLTSYGLNGDGVHDNRTGLINAMYDASSSGKAIKLPRGNYYVSGNVGVITDGVTISGDGTTIFRNVSDATGSDYTILTVMSTKRFSVNVTADLLKTGEIITVSSTSGINVGDIIRFNTNEGYSLRWGTSYTYPKGWMTKVSKVISSTQIQCFEKAPYDFIYSGNSPTLDIYTSGNTDIKGLTFKWIGSDSSYLTEGLSIANLSNAYIDVQSYDAESACVIIANCYNLTFKSKCLKTNRPNIGYNYGINAGGLFYSTIEAHIYSTRHAIAVSDIPSVGLLIHDSYLGTIHDNYAMSFDAHCAEDVTVVNSYMPNGFKCGGGNFTFENCTITNANYNDGGQVVFAQRDLYFIKNMIIKNCRFYLEDSASYMYQINDYVTDYGNLTFEDNYIEQKANDGSTFHLLLFGGITAPAINNCGIFSIKNNTFNINRYLDLVMAYTSGGGNGIPTIQGKLYFQDNKIKNGYFSASNANLLFSTYYIKGTRTIGNGSGLCIMEFNYVPTLYLEDNELNSISINNSTKLVIKKNRFNIYDNNAIASQLRNNSLLYLDDNLLESIGASATNLVTFMDINASNVVLGNHIELTGITNSIGGVPNSMKGYGRMYRADNTLPTPSISYRALFMFVQGGTGVADNMYVCRKNSSNVYEWKSITV